MRKIITILMLLIVIGAASAAWYPRSADYNTSGDVNAANGAFSGNISVTGILTAGSTVNNGVIDGDVRLAANHSFYSTTGSGAIDWSNATGIFKTPAGTNTFYGNVVIAANKSLSGSSGSGAVDFSGMTGGYSSPLGTNTFNGNILGAGLTTTTTGGGAVTLKGNVTIYSDKTLATGTGAATLNGDTTVASNKALAVTTADKLTVGGVIVPQEMVITVPIGASEVDQSVFIADDAWQITKIEEVHTVAQNTAYPDTGSVSVTKCTGTQAPGSGTALHNTTMYLNSTVNTVVTPTLTGNTPDLALADGNRLALNFNGTMTTFAGGVVTIHMKRV